MGLFKKKPKRLKPVIERTFDEVPFVIPKIKNEPINKSNILQPKSPLYGTNISDKIYYPENKSVDVIKQYDAFRKVKKYTLEDEKKEEKGPYSEFNQVPRNNFASANVSESVRKKHEEEKKLTKEQEMEYEHSQMYNGEVHISKPIDIMEGIEVLEKPEYQDEPIIDLEE